jgi:hypothetical protein
MTNVRDIGDKAPFDKAPLEIRRQKTKRHVIDRKRKGVIRKTYELETSKKLKHG